MSASVDGDTRDLIQGIIKEMVGEVRAEINAEAEKLTNSLKEQYGSHAAAKAAGEEANIFARSGMAAPATEKKNPARLGRYMRILARNGGNMQRAREESKNMGDLDMSAAFERAMDERKTKAQLFSDFASGGALIPEDYRNDVIDLLYPAMSVMQAGAQILPMPNGQLTLPFIDSGITASYVGEKVNIPPSEQRYGQLQLNAKKLAAVTPISNDLLRTPSARADEFVQRDIARRFITRMESAFLNDDGTNGTPKGLVAWAPAANKFTAGANDLTNKVANLGTLQRLVQDNDVPLENGAYIISPRTEWSIKLQLDGLGNFPFMPMMEAGSLMGQPFFSTNNVPNNLGGGNDSYVLFGAMAHVVVGDTETLELTVHPDGAYHDGSAVQSGISMDCTPIRGISRHDIGCQYRGNEIAVAEGVQWT